ncbi:DUF2207 domain-containing protein [Candidatus Saccharibacteria bacterium]|nr:DUF2207 domain-containing protein [Candidatus Saccharibacteria bacterium]MBP7834950.1 DUF2207 domain-containing protein [Candidatus Saccharibacteria bacterium]
MNRLKSVLIVFSIILFGLLGLNGFTNAQDTQNFIINNFHADYYLSKDNKGVGVMNVTETITAGFPNYNQNHGILRALPLTYNSVDLKLKDVSVINQTTGSNSYSSSKQNGNLVLKIGDADTYVRNQQTYVIKYSMLNVITNYQKFQELAWNVNGTQWQQPIEKVSANIYISKEITPSLNEKMYCYTGEFGSKEVNCTIIKEVNTKGDSAIISTSTTNTLSPGQNLSFAISFQPNTFTIDKNAALMAKLKLFAPVVLGILVPLSFIVLLIVEWFRKGRDPKGRGVIIPQYIPLKELDVLEADTLLHEYVTQKSISAQIIELAIKKYITISEVNKQGKKVLGLNIGGSKDYELKLDKPTNDLSESEKSVCKMIFGDNAIIGDTKLTSELKDKAYTEVAKISKDVPKDLFSRGFFASNPSSAIGSYAKPSLILAVIWGIIGVALMMAGIIEWPGGVIPVLIVAGITIVITNIIASKIMPSKTAKGVDAKEYLLGLQEYIKLAEADRLKYLQSPEGAEKYGDPNTNVAKVKLFEKLLPYAIIFGLEKQWANSFQDIYKQPPDWYQGNYNSFTTGALIGSLASFDSASSVSFSAPSSSGGGSGFGGGGSSGGGGGGGGGGGW